MSVYERDIPIGTLTVPNKRPRRTSEVWNHFHDSPDGERAICKSCGRSLSARSSTGTSHLKRHVESCQNVPERGNRTQTQTQTQTPYIDWQPEEIIKYDIVEEPESYDVNTSSKTKHIRSIVWDHFKRTPDRTRAVCNHCNKSFCSTKGSGTSHLKRHLEKCDKRSTVADVKFEFGDQEFVLSKDYKDQDQDRTEETHLDMDLKIAIMAEIPLLSSDCKKVWHGLMGPIDLESEVCDYYENERKKFALKLNDITSRVTFVCEMARNEGGYISVSVFFIDDEFNLVKRLIGFKKCDSGIVASIESCISEWKLEDKIFAVALDPGFDQINVMIDSLRAKYASRMLFDGQYIHMPCYKKTLVDFINHTFYSFIFDEGRKMKEFFESLMSIPSRLSTFNKLATDMGLPLLDVIWLQKYAEDDMDSVVRLLNHVIVYRGVFEQYIRTEIGRWHFTPTNPCVDWKRVELAVQIIKPINDIMKGWSGIQCPTPNLYFQSILQIKAIISSLEKDISENESGENNISSMKDAISDHLGTCNELFFISCVLDPRFKLLYLEYCFEKIFESNRVKGKLYRIRECLRMFYDEYEYAPDDETNNNHIKMQQQGSSSSSSNYNSAPVCHATIINEFSVYKKHVKTKMRRSELDEYLSEDVVDVSSDADFNLLGWWKLNRLKYPVLSRIARDVLIFPMFCSSDNSQREVNPKLVEAVMCVKAWIISGAQR